MHTLRGVGGRKGRPKKGLGPGVGRFRAGRGRVGGRAGLDGGLQANLIHTYPYMGAPRGQRRPKGILSQTESNPPPYLLPSHWSTCLLQASESQAFSVLHSQWADPTLAQASTSCLCSSLLARLASTPLLDYPSISLNSFCLSSSFPWTGIRWDY